MLAWGPSLTLRAPTYPRTNVYGTDREVAVRVERRSWCAGGFGIGQQRQTEMALGRSRSRRGASASAQQAAAGKVVHKGG